MKTNKTIIIAIALLLIAGVAFYLAKQDKATEGDTQTDIIQGENNGGTIVEDPIKVSPSEEKQYHSYMEEASKYKSKADAGDKASYQLAIASYQKAADIAEGKIWLPYLNIGNVYRLLGEYANAAKAYDIGLAIAPDSALYIAKIELFEVFEKRPFTEVKRLYDEALKKTVENLNIYVNYAAFLKANGEYTDALAIYKTLSEKYPTNEGYKTQIRELEAKING